ncbi:uncharacterized protein LAESUDRAFT_816588 [Laetiporus sulphureus 93-53]|uniref:Uncharacterized protein n=1 Tax=Laetiporus sulphureus 93-53 TaxID=1314785 RepID=A0A165B5P2_9APHY|nr:uncharacterized protein LAESUDRAFT_816588 [Laetiporus sulphureus 93-53]KZT00294.1 hypothetical protein LAESUDRAFT_816588 [Laetiporus sulphureus 93-53]
MSTLYGKARKTVADLFRSQEPDPTMLPSETLQDGNGSIQASEPLSMAPLERCESERMCQSSDLPFSQEQEAHLRSLPKEASRKHTHENSQLHEYPASPSDLRNESAELRRALYDRDQRISSLQNELVLRNSQIEGLMNELNASRALSQARADELRAANAYHTTVGNTVSDADVRHIVENLNEEIYQLAAQIVHVCESSTSVSTAPSDDMIKRAENTIGSLLTKQLRKGRGRDEPMLIQVAMQSCIIHLASKLTRAWAFMLPQASGNLMYELWGKMKVEECQTVAGRWRALTMRHLAARDTHQAALWFARECAAHLENILYLVRLTKKTVKEAIHKYSDKITNVFDHVLSLQRTVVEDITACEFQLMIAKPGQRVNLETMDDEYGDGHTIGDAPSPVILCNTGMGLCRVAKVGEENKLDTILLLKSRVVSDNVLHELDTHSASGRESKEGQREEMMTY